VPEAGPAVERDRVDAAAVELEKERDALGEGNRWNVEQIRTLTSLMAERDRVAAGWQARQVGRVASYAPEASTIPASWPEITRRRQLALEDGDTESESASDTFRRWRRPR